jgi:hypothetical protein
MPQATPEDVSEQPDPHSAVVRYDSAARVVLALTDNSDAGQLAGFMSWLERSYGKDISTR